MSICSSSIPSSTTSVKEDVVPFHERTSNYSLHDAYIGTSSSSQQRKIHNGDQETRIKQLYQQIEQLSLSNARLVRVNRVLKLDSDKIVEENTAELKQALKLSIEQNIRLQRANRLLKYEYNAQTVK